MKRILALVLCFGVFTAATATTFAKTKPSSKTYTGTLCDKMCSPKMTADAMKCSAHTKGCMTSGHCSATGYGIVMDGKYYKFDKNGDKLASTWLSTTSKGSDMQVSVTGVMKGSTIKVSDLKEKM